MYDSVIVGGGPAGLSAALFLGRCRRRVLLCDAGHPRNERSRAMHGYLSRDGMPPGEFVRICREEVGKYPSVQTRTGLVAHARRAGEGFEVEFQEGGIEAAHTLLLATGVVDELPRVPGFDQFYGRSAHNCPYCDGWEHRDEPLAVHGGQKDAAELAMELLLWSRDVVLCMDGEHRLANEDRVRLTRRGVRIREERIERLEGVGDLLGGVRLEGGDFLPCKAFFFSPGQRQRSPLAEEMGCKFQDDGMVDCGEDAATCVRGLFVAGNASRGPQMVILAAAEGTRAGFAINEFLMEE